MGRNTKCMDTMNPGHNATGQNATDQMPRTKWPRTYIMPRGKTDSRTKCHKEINNPEQNATVFFRE